MMSGGGREVGWVGGGVKKCFLGLRRTALMSAEGKKMGEVVVNEKLSFSSPSPISTCVGTVLYSSQRSFIWTLEIRPMTFHELRSM
jgi:hypothetical protein